MTARSAPAPRVGGRLSRIGSRAAPRGATCAAENRATVDQLMASFGWKTEKMALRTRERLIASGSLRLRRRCCYRHSQGTRIACTLRPVRERPKIHARFQEDRKWVVPRRGLEPPRLSPLVPETSASTNSATWALARHIGSRLRPCQRGAAGAYTGAARSCIRRLEDSLSPTARPRRRMTLRHNINTLVTVFGGSGFLGRHVVRALARRDFRIRAAVRRPDLAIHLQPLGRVGQIHAVQANVRYPASVEPAVRDADIVINLVGILFERGRQTFDLVQGAGAGQVARAAAAAGARMVHVSALGADSDSPSLYGRSKAAGE